MFTLNNPIVWCMGIDAFPKTTGCIFNCPHTPYSNTPIVWLVAIDKFPEAQQVAIVVLVTSWLRALELVLHTVLAFLVLF